MSVLDQFMLTGKKALVTRGNRGLGRSFATALAQAGVQVAIVGRDAERNASVVREAADEGLTLVPITADITEDADVNRMDPDESPRLGRKR